MICLADEEWLSAINCKQDVAIFLMHLIGCRVISCLILYEVKVLIAKYFTSVLCMWQVGVNGSSKVIVHALVEAEICS